METSDRPIETEQIRNQTKFRMETVRAVLCSIHQDYWMVSIDLQDAYLQFPMHHASRKYLRFVSELGAMQFKSLCFGLSTAPQVFTRRMAPVSGTIHELGTRMLRYVDDWLTLASSREAWRSAMDKVIELCKTNSISTSSLIGDGDSLSEFEGSPTPQR